MFCTFFFFDLNLDKVIEKIKVCLCKNSNHSLLSFDIFVGPPVAGLLRTGSSSAWPSTGGIGLSSGLSHLGSSSSSTTILGQPVAQASAGFSYSSGIGAAGSSNSSTLTSTLNSLNNTASTTLNMSAATKQPFMLQKPPQGAKRGKR